MNDDRATGIKAGQQNGIQEGAVGAEGSGNNLPEFLDSAGFRLGQISVLKRPVAIQFQSGAAQLILRLKHVAILAQLNYQIGAEISRLEQEIYLDVGHEFNLGSPKQLEQILFFELNLPKGKRTKTGYSTDASVLEELRPAHPMIDKLLEWRVYTKLRSTYVEALPHLHDLRDRLLDGLRDPSWMKADHAGARREVGPGPGAVTTFEIQSVAEPRRTR